MADTPLGPGFMGPQERIALPPGFEGPVDPSREYLTPRTPRPQETQGPTLAQRIRRQYPGVYDQLDNVTLEAKVLKTYPGVYDHLPRSSDQQPESGGILDTALDLLPTAGAIGGGIIGGAMGLWGGPVGMGAGGVAGAGVGGFTGKSLQNLGRAYLHGGTTQYAGPKPQGYVGPGQDQELNSSQALSDMGRSLASSGQEGLIDAATEGAGRLVLGLGGAAGRRLLRTNLRLPGANSAAEAARNMEIARTAEQEGTNIYSPTSLNRLTTGAGGAGGALGSTVDVGTGQFVGGGQGGINALDQRISGIVQHPQGPGSPISWPTHVADRLTEQPARFAAAGAAQSDRQAVARVGREFLEDVPQVPLHSGYKVTAPASRMTPSGRNMYQAMSGSEVQASRRAAGASLAQADFGITQSAEVEARKELYHQLGEELKRMYPGAGPDQIAALMDRERRLIDLRGIGIKASDRAANKAGGVNLRYLIPAAGAALGYGGQGGGYNVQRGVTLTALGAALASPDYGTRAALLALMAARHPQLVTVPGQMLAGAIQGGMQGDQ